MTVFLSFVDHQPVMHDQLPGMLDQVLYCRVEMRDVLQVILYDAGSRLM